MGHLSTCASYLYFKELEECSKQQSSQYEDQVRELDSEVQNLREDLEALLSGTQAVGAMLLQEGLDDVAQGSLGEQVSIYSFLEKIVHSFHILSSNTNFTSSPQVLVFNSHITASISTLKSHGDITLSCSTLITKL